MASCGPCICRGPLLPPRSGWQLGRFAEGQPGGSEQSHGNLLSSLGVEELESGEVVEAKLNDTCCKALLDFPASLYENSLCPVPQGWRPFPVARSIVGC